MTEHDLTVSAVDAEHRAFVHALPVIRLTAGKFAALPEYSCSQPTGTTPGMMWKRLDGSHNGLFKRQGGKPRWLVFQYDPDCPPEAKTIRILRFRPVIVVTAKLARPIREKVA